MKSTAILEAVALVLSIAGVVTLTALGHGSSMVDNGLFAIAGAAAGHAFGRNGDA